MIDFFCVYNLGKAFIVICSVMLIPTSPAPDAVVFSLFRFLIGLLGVHRHGSPVEFANRPE